MQAVGAVVGLDAARVQRACRPRRRCPVRAIRSRRPRTAAAASDAPRDRNRSAAASAARRDRRRRPRPTPRRAAAPRVPSTARTGRCPDAAGPSDRSASRRRRAPRRDPRPNSSSSDVRCRPRRSSATESIRRRVAMFCESRNERVRSIDCHGSAQILSQIGTRELVRARAPYDGRMLARASSVRRGRSRHRAARARVARGSRARRRITAACRYSSSSCRRASRQSDARRTRSVSATRSASTSCGPLGVVPPASRELHQLLGEHRVRQPGGQAVRGQQRRRRGDVIDDASVGFVRAPQRARQHLARLVRDADDALQLVDGRRDEVAGLRRSDRSRSPRRPRR